MSLPILYSFRRCPYAMRARMALHLTKTEIEHREIRLKNKPPHMLKASPKGTVPVLILPSGQVIDESLDLALWALSQSRRHNLNWNIDNACDQHQLALICQNDQDFKHWLDRYKYHVGYPEQPPAYYREKAEVFLAELDMRLKNHTFLFSEQPSLADIAIFPFIRQFAFVDTIWFDQATYPNLQRWLRYWLGSNEFEAIMNKYPEWSGCIE